MVQQDDLDMWLTAEDIGEEAIITFFDEGKYENIDVTDGVKRVFQITVTLPSGEQRLWTMNRTSRRKIARELGEDSVQWVGRKVKLYTALQNVFGKDKQVIYVREVITNTQPSSP